MTPVSAFNTEQVSSSSRLPSQFSKLSSEDFIRIIFTELSNQDPFKPNDSQALLSQLDSIRSIEADIKLTKQLETLVAENQLTSASNMIGKFIAGLSVDNFRVAGFVTSVHRVANEVHLELDNGWVVPINGVEQVINPSAE
jgi:flagellar basal-body rod modification protein FlgD